MQRDLLGYLIALGLTRGQPLLEAFIVSAFLSVEAFGAWSWAIILWGLTISLTHFGVPAAVLRYSALPEVEKGALFWHALSQIRWPMLFSTALLGGLSWTTPPSVRWLCWCLIPLSWTQHAGEVVRSFFRGQYANLAVARWQIGYSLLTLISLAVGTYLGGLVGAIVGKALQAVWQAALALWLLPLPRQPSAFKVEGFGRFAWRAYWGNLAHDLLFYLPGALLGWRVRDPIPIAYWRWATLLPLNLRQIAAYFVLYLYPKWAADSAPAKVLYRQHRAYIWLGTLALYGVGILWLPLWDLFPGPTYTPAKGPYLFALAVGLIWSTEALLLPNLLSAKGNIAAYARSYVGGLFAAVPTFWVAGGNLYLYLGGLGLAGLASAAIGFYYLRRH